MMQTSQRPLTDTSFRDPDGALLMDGKHVVRLIVPEAAIRFADVLSRPVVQAMIDAGDVVATAIAPPAVVPLEWRSLQGTIYEHQRAPFVSHPCEWPPAMLARAAEFSLEIALRLLPHGLMLKDATPTNIQFFGSRPVLVDVPSIVTRPPGMFLWPARQQFETTFLLPLLANIETGLPLGWALRNGAMGVSHEFCARLLGARRWLKPSLIAAVALPAALGASPIASRANSPFATISDDDKARYILGRGLETLLKRTRSATRALSSRVSHWSAYQTSRAHYDGTDLARKTKFVSSALEIAAPRKVLDIGANTGEFSALAAGSAEVVAMEVDEVAGSALFRRAMLARLPIHPVIVDFAQPTPSGGWRNAESSAFLARSRAAFDLVLVLAVIHHLRVTNGIPVTAIVEALWEVTRDYLLIEFVPRSDSMFRQIARGREALYDDCDRESFEACLTACFTIGSVETLSNDRVLYLARRRAKPGEDASN